MSRDEINAYGHLLMGIREHFGEDYVIVSIGARGPNHDCRNGNAVATLRRGNDEATSEALHLFDAIALAQGKIERMRAAREQEKAA